MKDNISYIPENKQDKKWGLTVCSLGIQKVGPGETYPPPKHNPEYMFNPSVGRVLSEYQLLYITEGRGRLVTEHGGSFDIKAGNMFLIFPGEKHSYYPDPETGWSEYWIGFKGNNVDSRKEEGFFSPRKPVYDIGYNEKVIELYREAFLTAKRQESFFQQLLAGIVNHLLGLMFMTDGNNRLLPDEEGRMIVNRARAYMQESVETDLRMPEVAEYVGVNYTTFRTLFKQYTGLSPAQYFINLKIHRAKEMLRSTSASIKEISIILQFENPEYFATQFKKKTGVSPTEFRKR
ncbi:MAG: AraC family transcriptional regulator [Bacteroidales bacterium]|nr:AraC family transcriptional regulator [Bacteroidales bacterium]